MRPICFHVHIHPDDALVQALRELVNKVVPEISVSTTRGLSAAPGPNRDSAGTGPHNEALLLNTRQVAKLLQVCPRTVWTMTKTGRMPAPIRIGKSVRWSREQLRSWIIAGGRASD